VDPVEGFKLLAEILLERSAVADVWAVGVLEILKFGYQISFD